MQYVRISRQIIRARKIIARGPVRNCGRENDRKHCPGDLSPSVYVRRHWRPVVQGRPFS